MEHQARIKTRNDFFRKLSVLALIFFLHLNAKIPFGVETKPLVWFPHQSKKCLFSFLKKAALLTKK